MSTSVGVGISTNSNSSEAGAEAVRGALKEAGVESCDLLFLFGTGKHDAEALRKGAREAAGDGVKIVGGATAGIITNELISYDGYEVGALAISSDDFQADVLFEGGLDKGEVEVGRRLGKRLAESGASDQDVLLMYDSLKMMTNRGPALNLATPLLQGLQESMGAGAHLAGAGVIGTLNFAPTWQFVDDEPLPQAAIATRFTGDIKMDVLTLHGCRPMGDYHTITKVDGGTVLEIDGIPAVDAIKEMLGPDAGRAVEDFPFFITLGINRGDKWGDFKDEDYQNRLVMAIDAERGGLVMFEPDLEEGTEVQLMRRSIDLDYIGEMVDGLFENADGRKPLFALYLNCAGRARALSGTEREDAEEVQRAFRDRAPLLGTYTGVEIAPIQGKSCPLDWTGVLCVFSQ